METKKKFMVKIVVFRCGWYGNGLLEGEAPRFLEVRQTSKCGVAYNLEFVDSGSVKIQRTNLVHWDLAHLTLNFHSIGKHYVIAREGQGTRI